MGCVQSYFRKAHNASLSPSSTQASDNAGLIAESPTDPKKQLIVEDFDDVITTPPTTQTITPLLTDSGISDVGAAVESNGGSKTGTGLGPGIAALAASTGTVAILGASADTTIDAVDGGEQIGKDVHNVPETLIEEAEEGADEGIEEARSALTSPLEGISEGIKEENLISVPTSPAPDATEVSDDIKQTSNQTSPISPERLQDTPVEEPQVNKTPTPELGKSENASNATSPISADRLQDTPVENQQANKTPSPEPDKADTASKPTSSISADRLQDTPGEEQLVNKTPTPEPAKADKAESREDKVLQEPGSRPTSVIACDEIAAQTQNDEDEPFPAPPPPEVEESLTNIEEEKNNIPETVSQISEDKEEVMETVSRKRRSVSEQETTEDQISASASEQIVEENDATRPVSVDEVESKFLSRPKSVVEDIETVSELIVADKEAIITEINKAQDTVVADTSNLPSRAVSAIDDGNAAKSPEKDVEEESRPQSSQEVITEALIAEPVENPTDDVQPTTAENDVTEKLEVVEDIIVQAAEKLDEEEGEVEKVTEELEATSLVENAIGGASDLVTSAATTIQATFRGHQTRKGLRNVAGVEAEETPTEPEIEQDATPQEEDLAPKEQEVDVEEKDLSLDDISKEVSPPPPNDTESDPVDSLSVNDEKEPSVAVESIEEFTSTESKDDVQNVINVLITPEQRAVSQTGSTTESEQMSDDKSREQSSVPAESEPESLDAFINDVNRAQSESTVSLGDSISAQRGSETDSVNALSVSEELVAKVLEEAVVKATAAEEKMEEAATKIQSSFRGFHARQNLQKIADESELPLPEPPSEDPAADDDDLPPPPDDFDIEPPPPDLIANITTESPRSPETGEKLQKVDDADQVSHADSPGQEPTEDVEDKPSAPIDDADNAAKLVLLQKPQECDEPPENRWETEEGQSKDILVPVNIEQIAEEELAALQLAQDSVELPEHNGDVNGEIRDASSVEVDDSSLSSAATKIQAGARGYLTRKHMKDTFSTTAPSITDSQHSIGAALTSQEDDEGVHTSGSLETEVQRQSLEETENAGVTAVVIKSATDVSNGEQNGGSEDEGVVHVKSMSLDSQVPSGKVNGLKGAVSLQDPIGTIEDQKVWQTLQDELEEAATRIQSNFRGFSTRQRLQRENAVHMQTMSSGGSSEKTDNVPAFRSSGEFHDIMVLPPTPILDETSINEGMLAVRQTSDVGKRLEGPLTDVTTSKCFSADVGDARDYVIKMGEATEVVSQPKDMKTDSVTNAATKIQAGFRGYKVRKQMRQDRSDAVKKNGPRRRRSSHSLSLQSRRHTLENLKNMEATLQDRSATKIQAGIRGFLVRKRRRVEKDAAVKIQAGFRGYKVRREGKTRKPVEK